MSPRFLLHKMYYSPQLLEIQDQEYYHTDFNTSGISLLKQRKSHGDRTPCLTPCFTSNMEENFSFNDTQHRIFPYHSRKTRHDFPFIPILYNLKNRPSSHTESNALVESKKQQNTLLPFCILA